MAAGHVRIQWILHTRVYRGWAWVRQSWSPTLASHALLKEVDLFLGRRARGRCSGDRRGKVHPLENRPNRVGSGDERHTPQMKPTNAAQLPASCPEPSSHLGAPPQLINNFYRSAEREAQNRPPTDPKHKKVYGRLRTPQLVKPATIPGIK